jgi:hypothetical protein
VFRARGDRALRARRILACGTHLGEGLAFGAPPLLLFGALPVAVIRDRRRTG